MQMFYRALALSFVLITHSLAGLEHECQVNVPQDVWAKLTPYFLPNDHCIKNKLDTLFSSPDVLKNENSLKKNGFKLAGARGYSKALVLKHKKLKKYLLKVFTDDQIGIVEYEIWMRRVDGSHAVSSAIERHGFQKIFKVPKKWIYQVPRNGNSFEEKNFVLIVEDMEIYDNRGNSIMWNSLEYVTKEKLNALYTILKEVGLKDSIYIDNIPFSLDGRIAFVDTDHFYQWPVPYSRLKPALAIKMQDYWTGLILRDP